MNGEWLPFDHGWPARAVIPRWTAVASVKWLGRIYVDVEPIWVELNTLRYIMEGPGFAAVGRARGIPLTTTWIKSALALKWIYPDDLTPHELKAGPNRIRGYAWSPSAKIAKVMYAITPLATLGEWTTVDPARVSWREAKLSSVQKSEVEWVRFDFVWDARPGLYGILTRATDQKGNTQPLEMPTWNKFGYAWNRPVAHPVRVV
jgi:DMSO/TMAO reductase YedYZ molybdopterin-dependent catalytic subunit